MSFPAGRYLSYFFVLTKTAIFLAVVLILFHFFVATIFIVDGTSMLPNLESGQIVLVDRLSYNFKKPDRGDIVVLRYPGDPDKRTFVKRIIALPGERVSVKQGQVLVNGKLLLESYLAPTISTDRDSEIIITDNEYYTLGDNRQVSNDSRIFGTASRRFLVGRVSLIIFPISQTKIVPKAFY